jgi:hypothetical protein
MLIYNGKLRFFGRFCLVLPASPTFFNGLLGRFAFTVGLGNTDNLGGRKKTGNRRFFYAWLLLNKGGQASLLHDIQ